MGIIILILQKKKQKSAFLYKFAFPECISKRNVCIFHVKISLNIIHMIRAKFMDYNFATLFEIKGVVNMYFYLSEEISVSHSSGNLSRRNRSPTQVGEGQAPQQTKETEQTGQRTDGFTTARYGYKFHPEITVIFSYRMSAQSKQTQKQQPRKTIFMRSAGRSIHTRSQVQGRIRGHELI